MVLGRTSHEVRGLKWLRQLLGKTSIKSHLTRGAWIEIGSIHGLSRHSNSRTSHEVRGLKFKKPDGSVDKYVLVAPHTRCVD